MAFLCVALHKHVSSAALMRRAVCSRLQITICRWYCGHKTFQTILKVLLILTMATHAMIAKTAMTVAVRCFLLSLLGGPSLCYPCKSVHGHVRALERSFTTGMIAQLWAETSKARLNCFTPFLWRQERNLISRAVRMQNLGCEASSNIFRILRSETTEKKLPRIPKHIIMK